MKRSEWNKVKAHRPPDFAVAVYLSGVGWQVELLAHGRTSLSSCRDFRCEDGKGKSVYIAHDKLIEAFEAVKESLRELK